jgi:hypothetical protein
LQIQDAKRYFIFSFAALGVVSIYEIGRSSWRPENLAALKIGESRLF